MHKYIITTCRVCCLCMMVSGLTILHWTAHKEGSSLRQAYSFPSSQKLSVIFCLGVGPCKNFHLPHLHVHQHCQCSLVCTGISRRDCFTPDFLAFWLSTTFPSPFLKCSLKSQCRCYDIEISVGARLPMLCWPVYSVHLRISRTACISYKERPI